MVRCREKQAFTLLIPSFFYFFKFKLFLENYISQKDQVINMEKEITLNQDELIEYVKNEVKTYDTLEISYNRIFLPTEVIDVEHYVDENDLESLNLVLQINGELLNDTVQLDLVEIKEEIVEVRHIKNEDDLTVIVVEDV